MNMVNVQDIEKWSGSLERGITALGNKAGFVLGYDSPLVQELNNLIYDITHIRAACSRLEQEWKAEFQTARDNVGSILKTILSKSEEQS
jgi:hypothetical protein